MSTLNNLSKKGTSLTLGEDELLILSLILSLRTPIFMTKPANNTRKEWQNKKDKNDKIKK